MWHARPMQHSHEQIAHDEMALAYVSIPRSEARVARLAPRASALELARDGKIEMADAALQPIVVTLRGESVGFTVYEDATCRSACLDSWCVVCVWAVRCIYATALLDGRLARRGREVSGPFAEALAIPAEAARVRRGLLLTHINRCDVLHAPSGVSSIAWMSLSPCVKH